MSITQIIMTQWWNKLTLPTDFGWFRLFLLRFRQYLVFWRHNWWNIRNSYEFGRKEVIKISHKFPSHKNSISAVLSVYLLGTQFWNSSGPETLRLPDIRYNLVRFSETVLWSVNRHWSSTGDCGALAKDWQSLVVFLFSSFIMNVIRIVKLQISIRFMRFRCRYKVYFC